MAYSQVPRLSIVVPVKDEAENIPTLAGEVTKVMEKQPWLWECLWVNDGSADETLTLLKKLNRSDVRHRYISFEANAGKSAALWAGFRWSKGEILATLDGDAQNDPADLPYFVDMVGTGQADMVWGYRVKRQDTLVKRLSSRIANAFRNWMTGATVRDVGCATMACRKECVEQVPQFAGLHRFLPTLVALQGFRVIELPANHRPRVRGESKYNIRNRLWVGLLDCFGVWWLKKRAFRFKVVKTSEATDNVQL